PPFPLVEPPGARVPLEYPERCDRPSLLTEPRYPRPEQTGSHPGARYPLLDVQGVDLACVRTGAGVATGPGRDESYARQVVRLREPRAGPPRIEQPEPPLLGPALRRQRLQMRSWKQAPIGPLPRADMDECNCVRVVDGGVPDEHADRHLRTPG